MGSGDRTVIMIHSVCVWVLFVPTVLLTVDFTAHYTVDVTFLGSATLA